MLRQYLAKNLPNRQGIPQNCVSLTSVVDGDGDGAHIPGDSADGPADFYGVRGGRLCTSAAGASGTDGCSSATAGEQGQECKEHDHDEETTARSKAEESQREQNSEGEPSVRCKRSFSGVRGHSSRQRQRGLCAAGCELHAGGNEGTGDGR